MPRASRRQRERERDRADAYTCPFPNERAYGHQNVYDWLGDKPGPPWHDFDFERHPHKHTWKDEEERVQAHRKAAALDLPDGILVAVAFSAKIESVSDVAAYAEFKSIPAMQTFVDTVGKSPLPRPGGGGHHRPTATALSTGHLRSRALGCPQPPGV